MEEADADEPRGIDRKVPRWVAVLVIGAVLVVVLGFVHVVYGGGESPRVCRKSEWSPWGTFVDVDDYLGKPRGAFKASRLIDDLEACGVLH